MKIKYILTVAAIVAVTKSSFAQYSGDALKFSQFQTGSTARIKGIGNAGSAIGGDLSSISGNPAGIAFFTKSELSITPEFNDLQAKSSYFTSPTSGYGANKATSDNLNFNNAAAVFYSRLNTPKGRDKGQGWLSLNFGISYNRTSDFYGNATYGGTNTQSSISNYFAQLANGDTNTPNDNSLQNFGYNHYLIDSLKTKPTYRSNVIASSSNPLNQLTNTYTTGGQTAINLAMGANYSNKFYIGFGVGITNLRYTSNSTFSESGYQYIDKLNYSTQYTQTQTTKGVGFNGTLGFIYKPVDAVRIGASLTTPTWYTIDDIYSESLNTQYKGSTSYSNGPTDDALSYGLRTPLKVSGGIAIFFQKYGFITGDVEYLDYSSIHLSTANYDSNGYYQDSGYNPSQDNADIGTLYRSTVNAHFGGEARITSNFSLRGGYGIQGSPYVNKAFQNNIKTISGGFGYRYSDYYFDVTYANVSGTSSIYPYVLSSSSGLSSPYANIDRTYNNVFLTVGLRF